MMVSLGVGGVAAGHHPPDRAWLFKALLFLGSGSVIHGCHEEQDIRRMGALRRVNAGHFSDLCHRHDGLERCPDFLFRRLDEGRKFLHVVSEWSPSRVPYFLMLTGVVLTALYMTRQMIYVFFGSRREGAAHAHESPPVMTWPLVVLGILHHSAERHSYAGMAVAGWLSDGRNTHL